MPNATTTSYDSLEALLQPAEIERATKELGLPSSDAYRDATSGVRAARIASILQQIEDGYTDHRFSTRTLAEKLGLSVRYVQDLLQGSGASITDRIMELRLRKAQTMLTSDAPGGLKISEVAYSCGFNELSYFHRSFRRRFGTTPGKYRNQLRN